MDPGRSHNGEEAPAPLSTNSTPHDHTWTCGAEIFTNTRGFFANAHHFVMNQPQLYDFSGMSGQDILRFCVAPGAIHDAKARSRHPRCFPGTRERVISLVSHWMNGRSQKPIMWLNGPAGCGKTTIAHTIAERYAETKQLAASFFFSQDSTDWEWLFPTLAYQLAKSFPGISELIESAVKEEPLIATKAPRIQFARLIEEPMRVFYRTSPQRNFIVIVDAVDMYNDADMQEAFLKLIRTALPDISEGINFPVRFLICSRRERHLERAFKTDSLLGLTDDLSLISDPDISSDIRKFLTHEFSRIRRKHAKNMETHWPVQDAIDQIVQKSSGLFIYASAIVRFIDAPHRHPAQELEVVLGLRPTASRQPFSELDALYLEILGRQTDYPLLMKVLVYVVALGQPETRYVSQQLREEQLGTRLGGIVSLLHVSLFIESHHVCFLEFIQDATRAREYYVSPFEVLQVRYPVLAKIQIFAYFALARRSYTSVFLMAPAVVVLLPLLIFRVLISGFSTMVPTVSKLSILERFVPSNCIHSSIDRLPLSSCHPGTQEVPLKLITDWINDPTASNSIMVVRGVAGTGKSTIACTVAKRCEASGRFAAIFFYLGGKYSDTATSLIPSLALSLAKTIPTAEAYIKSTLVTDPFLPTKSIKIQIDRLIVKVFELLHPPYSEKIAVIIDGVDLFPEDSQMGTSLRLFFEAVVEHRLPLRVLICGRTHNPIMRMFETQVFSSHTSMLTLDGENAPARAIQTFLQDRVHDIFQRRGMAIPAPSQRDLERLISRSGDNFVYATTAVEFLAASLQPHQTLRSLLNGDSPEPTSFNSELNRLYITILSRSRNISVSMSILASVVAVRRPLRTSIRIRRSVISESQAPNQSFDDIVNDSLQDLRSLLRISNLHVEAHHPFLLEFLQDRNQAREFYVSPSKLLVRRYFYIIFYGRGKWFYLFWAMSVVVATALMVLVDLIHGVPIYVIPAVTYFYLLFIFHPLFTLVFLLVFVHLYFLLCRVPGVKRFEKYVIRILY